MRYARPIIEVGAARRYNSPPQLCIREQGDHPRHGPYRLRGTHNFQDRVAAASRPSFPYRGQRFFQRGRWRSSIIQPEESANAGDIIAKGTDGRPQR